MTGGMVVCGGGGGVGGVGCGVWGVVVVWWCGGVGVWVCGGVGCVGCGGCGVVVVWWVGSPLALEHSKVCTLCDFGHLQLIYIFRM
jgi:hypothetical protein